MPLWKSSKPSHCLKKEGETEQRARKLCGGKVVVGGAVYRHFLCVARLSLEQNLVTRLHLGRGLKGLRNGRETQ